MAPQDFQSPWESPVLEQPVRKSLKTSRTDFIFVYLLDELSQLLLIQLLYVFSFIVLIMGREITCFWKIKTL